MVDRPEERYYVCVCVCAMDNAEWECVCMHAREKVSGTTIKRRRLCGCKRLGEIIINIKVNSNI